MIAILNNPLKTYWKVRHVFKFPKLRIYFGKQIRFSGYSSIFNLWVDDVVWKDHDVPEHIFSPIISITLFGKIQFFIEFGSDPIYWEQLIWYYFYCKDINKAREYWPWKDNNRKSTWTDKYLV